VPTKRPRAESLSSPPTSPRLFEAGYWEPCLYGSHGEEPAFPAATPPQGRYVPGRYMLFRTPKGTSFLMHLPQVDDICTALTVKNLRPRPPMRHSALRVLCSHQTNIILYPKRHIFFRAFTASGKYLYGARSEEPASPTATLPFRAEGDIAQQANVFLYPTRHIFFGAFTASA
jgi:hypothetical protein